MFYHDFILISNELFMIFITLNLLSYGTYLQNFKKYKPVLINSFTKFMYYNMLLLMMVFLKTPISTAFCFNFMLELNFLVYMFTFVITLLIYFWIIFNLKKSNLNFLFIFEYWIFILIILFSFNCVLKSCDFSTMYSFLELQGLCFYILMALPRTSQFTTEVSLKYFVINAFASCLLLFNMAILYMNLGSTNFMQLISMQNFNSLSYVSMMMMNSMIVIFFIKLGMVPFYSWLPETYSGMTSNFLIFLMTISKLILTVIFFKLLFLLNSFKFLILVSSLSSVLLGTFLTIKQIYWKKFLIFASITHLGWILITLMHPFQIEFQFSFLYYLLTYTMISMFSFSLFFYFKYYNGSFFVFLRFLQNLKNLRKLNSILNLMLTLILLSLAGIPPFIGFFMKFFIFVCSLKMNYILMCILLLLSSLTSIFYYMRMIQICFTMDSLNMMTLNKTSREFDYLMSMCTFFMYFNIIDPNLMYFFMNLILIY